MSDHYGTLIQLLEMSEIVIMDHLATFLLGLDSPRKPFINGEYLYLDSGHPICLVAHVDTVRNECIQPNIVIEDGVITNRSGILGADDRAGVYALMKIAEYMVMNGGNIPSLLFTNHEECGRKGVITFVESGILNNENLRIFVGFDRRGRSDYVSYLRSVPPEVEAYLESKGARKAYGSISDVAVLMEATDIPAVNLSIGYYKEHTSQERLVLEHMEENISRGIAICQDPIDKFYPVGYPIR